MNKKIKIIELLNKIANGEEVPENIKYYNRNSKESDIMPCCKENIIDKLDCNSIYLNDEVEIIEEQEEIDIQNITELLEIGSYEADRTDVKMNRVVINKLVQAVKQLDNKLKEEE